jgi:hypothetical protein
VIFQLADEHEYIPSDWQWAIVDQVAYVSGIKVRDLYTLIDADLSVTQAYTNGLDCDVVRIIAVYPVNINDLSGDLYMATSDRRITKEYRFHVVYIMN